MSDLPKLTVHSLIADTFESNPQLAEQLKNEGIQDIIAFGVQSDYCVRATSQGAIAAGFGVTLLQGAHSTYDTETKKAEEIERDIEEELKEIGVVVTSWASL
jgi:nicotinamidase-related amidase